ncbi:MAG TPA: arsenate reductase (glutaredoxin) [Pseudomonadales bacterium]|nr:arsenate reductase (glutaredoxin) [Pseudomonadales bacterium]
MGEVTIYHNPRCSKSRQTLALLNNRGLSPRVVHYLDSPPSSATLKRLLSLLRLTPRDLMRRQEAPYAELHLDDPSLGNDELIGAMASHPILIERPIVEANGRAALGRPPENVLTIL